jgi:predicted Fe-Mo cluster-binding NifX family protein
MKIAAITEDGETISQHFGRAAYYMVVTVEDGEIVERQLREKLGHSHFAAEPHPEEAPGQPHGMGPQAESRHARMAASIADCQVLLCGGMGQGAYQSMQAQGIRPIVTDFELINEAVRAVVDGTIVDQVGRLH